MPENELAALKDIYNALSRWDVDAVAEAVTHDFELVYPGSLPWGGTFHGADGLRAFCDAFREQVDGQWADPDEFLDGDDVVVVLGRLRGRAVETNRDFEVEFAHIWRLPDGVPSRLRSYFDTTPITAALHPSGD